MESESKMTESSTGVLWRRNEKLSLKSGPRHTVYWVKRNPKHKEFERDGALVAATEPSKFVTASSYAGGWLHNQKHGFGVQNYGNGNKYEGDHRHGKRDGTGTLWRREGSKLLKEYTGEWKNNKRHGVGVHYDKLGNKYEGSWFDGKKSGKGKYFYANGDVYEGEFSNDLRAGLGVLFRANGERYEGHWHNDVREGPGRHYFPTTNKVLQAEWVNDSPTCGVFSDIPPKGKGPGKAAKNQGFQLPNLGLEFPDVVLSEAFKETRQKRAIALGEEASRGNVSDTKSSSHGFSPEELEDISTAFKSIAEERDFVMGEELVAVLSELELFLEPEDAEQLLEELGATPESQISFLAIVGLLSSLRAPEGEEESNEFDNKMGASEEEEKGEEKFNY